jgi:hypothetical protein
MSVENISGADIVTTKFTPEYTSRNEHVPTDQTPEAKSERVREENKGQNIDSVA